MDVKKGKNEIAFYAKFNHKAHLGVFPKFNIIELIEVYILK